MSVSWAVFDELIRPQEIQSRTWSGVTAWASDIEALLGADRDLLARQRTWWDQSLSSLGGDPSARDWTSFLMLRREREEDWSDWLAQLLEDSTTGHFAHGLFGEIERESVGSYAQPAVHREVSFDGYRADLVIEWSDASYTHVEVKIGDPHLAKTWGTAERIETHFAHLRYRSDAVLLLPTQLNAWNVQQIKMGKRVRSLTWIDVACALRRALSSQSTEESVQWRVWAHSLCGAVEQDLLGLRAGRDPEKWARSLPFLQLRMASQLLSREGMTHAR
jgi:hypothetical protein